MSLKLLLCFAPHLFAVKGEMEEECVNSANQISEPVAPMRLSSLEFKDKPQEGKFAIEFLGPQDSIVPSHYNFFREEAPPTETAHRGNDQGRCKRHYNPTAFHRPIKPS